jgi:rhamnose utilization protein RhaD (predicted bifunctional aldolase and dehydrogenase)
VQAATGNTSIKVGPKLWIKVSGTWLADADRKDIFIPVDLAEIRGCVDKEPRKLFSEMLRIVSQRFHVGDLSLSGHN